MSSNIALANMAPALLQVRGLTKKGKEFFRFSSTLTEAIAHLRVADSHIWAGCQYVHNHFIEGTDKGLYMAPDRIIATEVRR
jgi:Bardet-Biedl syndrome 7 protein